MTKANPVQFLEEVRAELKKVVWPSRQEALRLTLVVIFVSFLVGAFISGIDFVLTKIMTRIIK